MDLSFEREGWRRNRPRRKPSRPPPRRTSLGPPLPRRHTPSVSTWRPRRCLGRTLPPLPNLTTRTPRRMRRTLPFRSPSPGHHPSPRRSWAPPSRRIGSALRCRSAPPRISCSTFFVSTTAAATTGRLCGTSSTTPSDAAAARWTASPCTRKSATAAVSATARARRSASRCPTCSSPCTTTTSITPTRTSATTSSTPTKGFSWRTKTRTPKIARTCPAPSASKATSSVPNGTDGDRWYRATGAARGTTSIVASRARFVAVGSSASPVFCARCAARRRPTSGASITPPERANRP